MQIAERSVANATVLELVGDFTFSARRELTDAVEKLKATGCRQLILNIEQVPFMDSAALGILALMARNFKVEHRRLSLLKPQPRVREMLAFANIPMIIPIFEKEDEALSALISIQTSE